ncbi:hypothetical protein N431DRAFT_465545 [Stipitochalara longipes BDJ]|nr:hypothetical protein N431DRAFT_465545 [Stipitochalara longipes BDJ]
MASENESPTLRYCCIPCAGEYLKTPDLQCVVTPGNPACDYCTTHRKHCYPVPSHLHEDLVRLQKRADEYLDAPPPDNGEHLLNLKEMQSKFLEAMGDISNATRRGVAHAKNGKELPFSTGISEEEITKSMKDAALKCQVNKGGRFPDNTTRADFIKLVDLGERCQEFQPIRLRIQNQLRDINCAKVRPAMTVLLHVIGVENPTQCTSCAAPVGKHLHSSPPFQQCISAFREDGTPFFEGCCSNCLFNKDRQKTCSHIKK